jgi:hypothetical protein
MPKLTVQSLELKNPKWPAASAATGQELDLSVDYPSIQSDQFIQFRVRNGDNFVGSASSTKGATTAKWVLPNLPDQPSLKFDALLREAPSPANGFETILGKVESPALTVNSFVVKVTKIDECFIPKAEKLEIKYNILDPGTAAKKGKIIIWGERHPEDKYLYSLDFNPVAGDTTWADWDGKANNGYLSGKYITPEFSPYRVQIVIGVDDGSVADAQGAGLQKVCVAETQFEIKVQNVRVRLQANRDPAVDPVLKPDQQFVIEPRTDYGAFAVKGRLALNTEPKVDAGWGSAEAEVAERDGVGRIRIEGKRHSRIGESLNQASSDVGDPVTDPGGTARVHRVANAYMSNNDAPLVGGGSTKYDLEKTLYKRPEIPIEIEAWLRSREPSVEAKKNGVFEKEAVGPAIYDVLVEDLYLECLYRNVAGPVALYDEARTYNKKAAFMIKRGKHDGPYNDGTNPVFTYWQERIAATADNQEEFGDTDQEFNKGDKELTVYLNGTLLRLDEAATADNGKPIKLDYAEVSSKKIKLRKGLVRDKDVVWIIRQPKSSLSHPVVANWVSYPPGDNCHKVYGGVRGEPASDAMLFTVAKDFTGTLAGKFPYTALNSIDLDPHKVDAAKRERVESQAILADGNQKGLAGIIFSPSFMAGDSYAVEGRLRENSYAREMGCVAARPAAWDVRGRTGTLAIWRLLTITASWRMPSPPASSGLSGGVGEDDPAAAGRAHPGNGRRMNFTGLNNQAAKAFHEWQIFKSDGNIAGKTEESHQNINLDTYRTFFNNKAAVPEPGFYNIANTAAITNKFVRWDPYREEMPKGIPANRQNLASWTMHNIVAKGADPVDAYQQVNAQITSWETTNGLGAADCALGGAPSVPPSGRAPAAYKAWAFTKIMALANEFMDSLIAQLNPPAVMRVMRWPDIYYTWIWADGNPATPINNAFIALGVAGYCRGSGQAFFFSESGNADTFEHEMGHSLLLAHFAAGGKTNFAWKHHDMDYPHCLMGYDVGNFPVALPAAKVGAGITIATTPRNWMCPKCLLKVRGWDEIKLPCNWTHPDVF